MKNLPPLLLVAFAFLLSGCSADDDDYTPPVFAKDLALSRLETNGNIVYAGHCGAVQRYQVQANGGLSALPHLPVTGQVQDLLVSDNRLYVALPEKVAVYGLQGAGLPQWQYQTQANPLYTRLAASSGLLAKLYIQDTVQANHQTPYFNQGMVEVYNHTGAQPLYQFPTEFRSSLALAAAQGTFVVGEEEQLLVYPADSLAPGVPGQVLNARLLGLQATEQGWVLVARDAPRQLFLYRVQQGQLVLQSQLPLAP